MIDVPILDYDFLIDRKTQGEIDNLMNWIKTELLCSPSTPVNKKRPVFWIDLFCGAGGTSTGIHFAGQKNMFVVACVNHDINAINSHKANHPHTLHFTEDIRDFLVVKKLQELCRQLRAEFPDCTINLWASLECTNFSKAKGGQSRDADSRTLANHMFPYLQYLNPDYFWVENVTEFMSWGPLHGRVVQYKQQLPSGKKENRKTCKIDYVKDENGKITGIEWDAIPESMKNGKDYLFWIDSVQKMNFKFDYKVLNSADYGSYQSRERLFLQFAAPGMKISWPEQTHTKDGTAMDSLFPMQKHKAVREILDLHIEGSSIFERRIYFKSAKSAASSLKKGKTIKEMFIVAVDDNPEIPMIRVNKKAAGDLVKVAQHFYDLYGPYMIYREDPLVENTIKRILAGCKKFVPRDQKEYTIRYNGGGVGTEYKSNSLENPMGTILSNGTHAIVQTKFIKKYYSGRPEGKVISINGSAGTVKCSDGQAIVTATQFISQDNSGNPKSKVVDINKPARTITGSGGKQNIVSTHHLSTYHGKAGLHDIDKTSPTVPTKDSVCVVQTDFIDETYGQSTCSSVDEPAGALTKNPKLNIITTDQHFIDKMYGTGVPGEIDKPADTVMKSNKFNLVKVERFIVTSSYDGRATGMDETAPTLLASRKHHYLAHVDYIYNPSYGGHFHTADDLSPTFIARQDKAPLSRVTHVYGDGVIYIYDDDFPAMVELKEFMAEWGIVDIKMRMLLIKELKKIQGFPEDYILVGTETEQKKYIGNAVEVNMAKALTSTCYETIQRIAA